MSVWNQLRKWQRSQGLRYRRYVRSENYISYTRLYQVPVKDNALVKIALPLFDPSFWVAFFVLFAAKIVLAVI